MALLDLVVQKQAELRRLEEMAATKSEKSTAGAGTGSPEKSAEVAAQSAPDTVPATAGAKDAKPTPK